MPEGRDQAHSSLDLARSTATSACIISNYCPSTSDVVAGAEESQSVDLVS